MNTIQPTIEQQQVLDLVRQGKNVFFTGPAGTGKSALISLLYTDMKLRKKKCAVTALTGLAATLVEGSTLHGFLGLGIMKDSESIAYLKDKLSKRVPKSTVDRWTKTDALIIDEVSMLRPDMFEKMDQLARFIRKNPHAVMGGMQLILCGDFAQCEPIYTKEEREKNPDKCIFLFESRLFQEIFPWEIKDSSETSASTLIVNKRKNTVLLKQIFRQEDEKFQQLLSRVRLCRHTEEDLDTLESRVIDLPEQKMKPIVLRAQRKAVDKINMEELRGLEPDEDKWQVYRATNRIYAIGAEKDARARYLLQLYEESCQSPSVLQLAKGAQVILTKNINVKNNFVNGSRGIVVDFKEVPGTSTNANSCDPKTVPAHLYPEVEFKNGSRLIIGPEVHPIEEQGERLAEYIQVPLRLAWALTIHKSQGMSLDVIKVSLDETVQSSGQAYVCISRVRDLEGLFFEKFDSIVIRINQRVIDYYTELEKQFQTTSTTSPSSSPTGTGTLCSTFEEEKETKVHGMETAVNLEKFRYQNKQKTSNQNLSSSKRNKKRSRELTEANQKSQKSRNKRKSNPLPLSESPSKKSRQEKQ